MNNIKDTVNKEETFDKLEIRLGRIIKIEDAAGAPKKAYRFTVDFGKFGVKTSVGRYTSHELEELKDKFVLGVLNFESKEIGDNVSEFLMLGVQYPKADSGEATPITPMIAAKIGSKLF